MSEILPDEHQPPIYKTGEGNPLHQTIYGQEPVESPALHEPEPLPEHIDLTTPDTIPSPEPVTPPETVEQTDQTGTTVVSESDHTKPETEEPNKESIEFKTNIENALKEVDAIVENVRRLKSADQTLTDEASYHAEKLRRTLNRADPRETGYQQIEQEIQALSVTVNQAIERTIADARILSTKTEVGVDEIKKQLKAAELATDPEERKRILDNCTQIFYDLSQTFNAKRVGGESLAEVRKKMSTTLQQADETSGRRQSNLNQAFPGQSTDSLVFQYARASKEFAQAFVTRNKQLTEMEITIDGDIKKRLANFDNFVKAASAISKPETVAPTTTSPEPQAETQPIPATNVAEKSEDEVSSNSTITASQREVIDQAFSDPTSRERLRTIINMFGTEGVKNYFQSKIENIPPAPEESNHI